MNLARILAAIAAVAVVAGAFSYWLSADKAILDGILGNEVASVSVTKDAITAVIPDASEVTIVPLAPPAPVQVSVAPMAAQAAAPGAVGDERLRATGLESAVLAEVDEGPISGPPSPSASGDVKVDTPAGSTATATIAATTNNPQGDPVQVPAGTIIPAAGVAASCGPAGTNCTKDFSVTVGDGLGGATVISTGNSAVTAAASPACSSKVKADFTIKADGSWTYTLDAGCVKKSGSGGP